MASVLSMYHSVMQHKGRLWALDENGKIRYEISATGEPKRVPRPLMKAPLAKVDLEKLKMAIMWSRHAATEKKLRKAIKKGLERFALREFWRIGWRPSRDGSRVLDSRKNPYLK